MGSAFQCDACDELEAGKPAQTVMVKPTAGHSEELALCSACLLAFNDWRVSRAPAYDQPTEPDRYA